MNASDAISTLLNDDTVGGVRTVGYSREDAPRSPPADTTELQVFPAHGTSVTELCQRLRRLDREAARGFEPAPPSMDGYVTLRVHKRPA